ncbi:MULTISPECIES: UvrD-helicase domain-containing protein [unclassified Pseudomonas]|uniref:UvrD-helicase domain-containing protein n=1 Tax=unclassified Pseudomonas TaxID=196821 RepID=UPI0012949A0B|nr:MULTISPECIES: ATP-dependent helicase [unclassified Pseudomonas]MQU10173.1 AAA family ATPase [Pseudomonas sp. FSL R10-2189]MQU36816.1 AAA family ATPase [Pseudomonas sp. FSL R10-2172]
MKIRFWQLSWVFNMVDLASAGLDSKQIAAIKLPGSVFLTACPGSGKTKTLTYKIATELLKITDHRKFVVAITYTHRAADEILERVERLGLPTAQLWIGTIHSFCLEWIIRPYAIYEPRLESGFTIINQPDTEALLEELCKSTNYPKINPYDCGYHFVNGKIAFLCSDTKKHTNVRDVLKRYFAILKQDRKIDFELILFFSHKLISKLPEIAKHLSNLFNIILLDEYQDTKEIQYLILFCIFSSRPDQTQAFIVGDRDQAIFNSLGGYAVAFDEFKSKSNLSIESLSLDHNYRSSTKIVEYFSHYRLHPGPITAHSEHKHYHSIISYDHKTPANSLEDEVERLIRYSLYVQGIRPEEICIVGPQWPSLAAITRRLMSRLPECSFDGPGMIPFGRELDNFWYKLSRLCLSDPAPDMYLRRVRWAAEVISALDDGGIKCGHTPKTLLKELNTIQLTEQNGMQYLELYFSKFLQLIRIPSLDSHPSLHIHYLSFFETARKKIARAKSDGLNLIEGIDNFKRAFRPRSGITISTIHGIKGAEFDNVIAFSLLQGMVPHWADPKQFDSAKKLLYVICSRARKNLFLISETGRGKTATSELENTNYSYDTVPER